MDARLLALVVDPVKLRRLRVAWRPDPERWPVLEALTAALLAADGHKMAIPAPAREAGYMTVDEYAALTGVAPRTVRRACQEGSLRAAKRGGLWHIPVAEFARRKAA